MSLLPTSRRSMLCNSVYHMMTGQQGGWEVGGPLRTAVDHADVVGDLLHLVDAVLVSQDRFELVLGSNDDAIGGCNRAHNSELGVEQGTQR